MNAKESEFLKMAVPAAQYAQRSFGVLASVTVAQAILESGWGESALAQKANNYFGIKAYADVKPEEYVEMPTTEFVDGRRVREMAKFARYPSPTLGFGAHARLLALAPRYKPVMDACRAGRAEEACVLLRSCGYSTNPDYAELLGELIGDFDLTQYDVPPGGPEEPAAQAQAPREEAA